MEDQENQEIERYDTEEQTYPEENNGQEEADYPEEVENYIQINEGVTVSFNNWMYDAIINKTLKEAENDCYYDLIDLLNESKRDSSGFLSLLHLQIREFRMMCRYMNKAYKKSDGQEKRVYIRRAHNQFLRQFQDLWELMTRDERYSRF